MTALQHLSNLADQRKAERCPHFPAKYIPKSRYNDHDANSLTRCIVDYLNLSGHFATRQASTGMYRADLQKFVGSQQRAGLPDVFAVVEGRAVFVEIKHGKDQVSDKHKETISDLQRAGALVYIAHSFQGFYDWFTMLLATPAEQQPLSFRQTSQPQ